jgi:hypothetical protein
MGTRKGEKKNEGMEGRKITNKDTNKFANKQVKIKEK